WSSRRPSIASGGSHQHRRKPTSYVIYSTLKARPYPEFSANVRFYRSDWPLHDKAQSQLTEHLKQKTTDPAQRPER
ncbi:MAG: hypothetical protein ACPH3H_12690, partial [Pseudomonadales bacterium]